MKKVLLTAVLLLVLLLASDFLFRILKERHLEQKLNAAADVKGAVIRLEAWPFLWHSRENSFPTTTLTMTLDRESIRYDPIVLRLEDFYFYKNAQCPGKTDLLLNGPTGSGTTTLREENLADVLRPRGDVEVSISSQSLKLVRKERTPEIVQSEAIDIRPNDISGDIAIGADKPLLIRLPEPVDGVTFQDVRLEENALILPFAVRDSELLCI